MVVVVGRTASSSSVSGSILTSPGWPNISQVEGEIAQ
jgi:hypothetical protein